MRISNSADDSFLEIFLPSNIVIEVFFNGIVEHSINGEVAALSVLFRVGFFNTNGASAVLIPLIFPKRGNFKVMSLFNNDNNSKVYTYRNGFREDFLHVFNRGISGDVNIIGRMIH